MSFPYQFVLSPLAQEKLYIEMARRGHANARDTVKELLLEGAGDREVVERATRVVRKMVKERTGA